MINRSDMTTLELHLQELVLPRGQDQSQPDWEALLRGLVSYERWQRINQTEE
jgi:uncharacterized alpha-E superfamily protein